jgi:hypothetical protein
VEEACVEEHGREQALAERLEEVVTEREGPRVDAEAFARMSPEDVALVSDVLGSAFEDEEDETGQPDADEGAGDDAEAEAEAEAEIARLQAEIEESGQRQLAYRRYLDALDS